MTELDVSVIKDEFFKWLSSKVNPSKISNFYFAYIEIEKFCLNKKILKRPLFETTNIKTIANVRLTVEKNKLFKISYKKSKKTLILAINYYYRFIKDNSQLFDATKISTIKKNQSVVTVSNDILDKKIINDNKETTSDFGLTMIKKDKMECNAIKKVNFNNLVSYTYNCPIKLSYFEETYNVFNSWVQLYITLLKCLLEDYDWIIYDLKGKSINSKNGRIDIGEESYKNDMIAPKGIADGLYLETGLDTSNIINKIKCFLDLCKVDYENIEIFYRSEGTNNTVVKDEHYVNPHLKMNFNKAYIDKSVKFFAWMRNKEGYAETLCQSYVSTINNIEKYAAEHNILGVKIYALNNYQELKESIDILFKNQGFRQYNEDQNNRFRVVLKKYVEFLCENGCGNIIYLRENSELLTLESVLLTDEIKNKIIKAIDKSFINGIRADSPIAQNKLRKKYFEMYDGEEIPLEMDIKNFIISQSVEFNGRYYVIIDEDKEQLRSVILEKVNSGVEFFYYEEFYNMHTRLLNDMHIFTVEVLHLQLQVILPKFIYYNQYFTTEKDVDLDGIISNCFSNGDVMSYEQIQEKLIYVPMSKIKFVLNTNNNFIWVRYGEYVSLSSIYLDEKEVLFNKENILKDISKKGFSSLTFQKVNKSMEYNCDFTEFAIREALYQKCLSSKYDKKGNIITLKGKSISVSEILKEFCLTHDELTEKQLIEYEQEVTGGKHRQSLVAAYKYMVRINKGKFISKKFVKFDVEKTDRALSTFVGDGIISLRDVTSFTSFPYVEGHNWNLYLLESYCRLYSIKYKYDCLFVNSKNIGALFSADKRFTDYTDVLANVIVKEDIPLLFEDVGNYLSDSGYIARRTNTINDVIMKAQAIMKLGG